MTEAEVRKECELKPNECIESNLGALDILSVKDDITTIGIVATGRTFTESVQSVISKMKAFNKGKK